MKRFFLAALSVLSTMGVASAQVTPHVPLISGIEVGANVGTLGIGPMIGYHPGHALVGVRAEGDFFGISHNFTYRDIDNFRASAKWRSVGAIADLYPFGSGLRISAGLKANMNQLNATASPQDVVYIGNNDYTPQQVGQLNARVKWNRVTPYVGLGFSHAFGGHFVFSSDFGALYQGTGRLTYGGTGLAAQTAQFHSDMDHYMKDIHKAMRYTKFYPVIAFSVGYRF